MRGGGKRVDVKSSSGVAANFRAKVIKSTESNGEQETPLVICGPGHYENTTNELKSLGQTRFT